MVYEYMYNGIAFIIMNNYNIVLCELRENDLKKLLIIIIANCTSVGPHWLRYTINGERLAGLNVCGFHVFKSTVKVFS